MPVRVNVSPPMVVLRPGDRVLIVLGGESDAEQVEQVSVTLRESFPGVEFVVMDGVTSICVQAGEGEKD